MERREEGGGGGEKKTKLVRASERAGTDNNGKGEAHGAADSGRGGVNERKGGAQARAGPCRSARKHDCQNRRRRQR